ncbi:TetR/AcrR family transcriptional regulator [Mycoplasmatota bacterium]|nr:TetR/AcrR family transcriptional regulator [Mycoplasmatota bacterium]
MPKPLFFNISDDKRERFLNAARAEFTHKSFMEVSVNTIVKRAGISRGSFYTYFDNLDACFTYIIKDLRDKRFQYAMTLLESCDNNFFTLVRKVFANDYDAFSESGKYSLFKNYIYYLQSNKAGNLKDNMILDLITTLKNKGVDFIDIFDIKSFNINEQEFLDLFEVVLLLMVNTFLKAETEGLDKQTTVSLFNKRIDYIEFGVRKV